MAPNSRRDATAAAAADDDDKTAADVARAIWGTHEARGPPGSASEHPNAARDAQFGLQPIQESIKRPKVKRSVECDVCGAEDAAKRCAKCGIAAYCSRECQVHHWKASHKQACATTRERCAKVGEEVVKTLRDGTLHTRVRVCGLESLDGDGNFTAAVECGLFEAICDILREEGDEKRVKERWHSGDACSALQFLLCTVFRGQRKSRAGVTTGFSKVDGARLASFLESSEEAWDLWLDASVAFANVACLTKLERKDATRHAHCHRAAREVWSGYSMILARSEVAAKLLGTATGTAEATAAAKKRLEKTGARLRACLSDLAAAPEQGDPSSVVEANANQMAAMFAYWARQANKWLQMKDGPEHFLKILKLRGEHLRKYKQMAVPLGEATLKKGRLLRAEESRAIMALATQQ